MRLEVVTPSGPAWVDLDRPRTPVALLLLGHGAGGGAESSDLVRVRDAAVAARIAVARVTQPYRVAGRRSPAPAPRLDEAWLAAVAETRRQRGLSDVPLFTGGRSSGARVACRTAAATAAAGVVALAFPVHPPGRPEKSRLHELEQPTVPVLVVQGDRDAFGMPPGAPGREIVVIEGADHALRKNQAAIAEAVVRFVTGVTGVTGVTDLAARTPR
jgi:uncharacterized protein